MLHEDHLIDKQRRGK